MDTRSALQTSLEQELAQAEDWARQGRQQVEHQRRVVAILERDGHDTAQARALLDTLLETQALHEDGVRRLVRELEALRARGPASRAGLY